VSQVLFLTAHHTQTGAQAQITEAHAHGRIRLGTLSSMCVFAAQHPLYEGVSVTTVTGGKLLRRLARGDAVAGGPPRPELELNIGVVITAYTANFTWKSYPGPGCV